MVNVPKHYRPWYRLHATTYFAVVVTLGALSFANLAGDRVDHRPYINPGFVQPVEHGWPQTFLRRGIQFTSIPHPKASIWKLSQGVQAFSGVRLAVNALLAAVVTVSVGAAMELWRRNRRRPLLQITIAESLTLVAVTGLFCMFSANLYRRHLENERFVAAIHRLGGYVHGPLPKPDFIWDLFEPRALRCCDTYRSIFIDPAKINAPLERSKAFDCLFRCPIPLSTVEDITMANAGAITQDELRFLVHAKTLRGLTIRGADFGDGTMAILLQMDSLASLSLDDSRFVESDQRLLVDLSDRVKVTQRTRKTRVTLGQVPK